MSDVKNLKKYQTEASSLFPHRPFGGKYLPAEFGHEAAESVQVGGLFFLLIPTEIVDLHNNNNKMENCKNVKEIE
jgi:hypothetical protein